MKEKWSVCPYDCPDACGLIFEVEADKVKRVKGNPKHPFTRGTLCPKMVHYEETIHNKGRILTPLKRIGKKGEGKFKPITWEEAIAEIANNFKHSIATYGSESVLSYSYAGTMGIIQKDAGTALFNRLGATRQDRGICSPAKSYGWSSVMGSSYGTKSYEMAHSDMVVLWGINALNTNIHIMHDVRAAKKRKAKIWGIDTHLSTTLQQADEKILIRPGSDGAFALAVMHIIERDGLANYDFIRQHVQGYEKLTEELPKYTPEWASELTGVEVEQIEAFAHAYAKAAGPYIRLGSGLSRFGNGAMTVRIITCLPAVVGAYNKTGGGFLASTGGVTYLSKEVVAHNEWLHELPKLPRLMPMIKLGEALTTWQEPPITSLYIYSSNPAITAPDQNVVRQGLMREDLFIAVHERFMTDTTKYADIVLPATTSAEHTDIYNSYGHYNLAVGYRAIPPVGESKSNWEVFCLLAKAMGLVDDYFDFSEEDLVTLIVDKALHLNEVERTQLLNGELVSAPLPDDYKMQFKTATGKIEIWNPTLPDPLPYYFEPYGDEGEFWLLNTPDPRILDSSFNELDFPADQDKMVVFIHPEDAAGKQLKNGQKAILFNGRGEVKIDVRFDDTLKRGTLLAPGVWAQRYSSDEKVSINALTSARPTDSAWGSTFYDVKVDIRPL